jgi:hypothetical protein
MMYPRSTQRTYLFTDFHNIYCGDLEWRDLSGATVPLKNPPEPARTVVATHGIMPYGIRLVAQKAQKTGRIPSQVGLPSGLLYENGTYRAWFPIGPTCESFGYAESNDGLTWKLPKLRPQGTSTDPTGNAVFGPEWVPELRDLAGVTIFRDDHGEPSERYKMIFIGRPRGEAFEREWEKYSRANPLDQNFCYSLDKDYLRCVYGAVSPDGIHWKALPDILFVHFIDTWNTVYYDHWFKRYVMYTRDYGRQRRVISRVESPDFRHWGPVLPCIDIGSGERPTLDIYANGFTQYPGEPDIRIMFPQVYDRWDQTSHLRLSSSPDGYLWHEVPGGPVLTGGAPGEWDSEYLAVGTGLVPFGDDRVGVMYEGMPYPHKYPRWKSTHPAAARNMGWAYWPEGRLSALKADEVGEFHTFPMKPRGTKLQLNFRTYLAGSVQVGINNRPGFRLEDCDTLVGDSRHQTVSWKGRTELDISDGKDVTLHVKMRCAELFAISWV